MLPQSGNRLRPDIVFSKRKYCELLKGSGSDGAVVVVDGLMFLWEMENVTTQTVLIENHHVEIVKRWNLEDISSD